MLVPTAMALTSRLRRGQRSKDQRAEPMRPGSQPHNSRRATLLAPWRRRGSTRRRRRRPPQDPPASGRTPELPGETSSRELAWLSRTTISNATPDGRRGPRPARRAVSPSVSRAARAGGRQATAARSRRCMRASITMSSRRSSPSGSSARTAIRTDAPQWGPGCGPRTTAVSCRPGPSACGVEQRTLQLAVQVRPSRLSPISSPACAAPALIAGDRREHGPAQQTAHLAAPPLRLSVGLGCPPASSTDEAPPFTSRADEHEAGVPEQSGHDDVARRSGAHRRRRRC